MLSSGEGHRFLVTLREPIAVLESEYFHLTPLHNVSQAGLEHFARLRAPDVFLAQVWLMDAHLRRKARRRPGPEIRLAESQRVAHLQAARYLVHSAAGELGNISSLVFYDSSPIERAHALGQVSG